MVAADQPRGNSNDDNCGDDPDSGDERRLSRCCTLPVLRKCIEDWSSFTAKELRLIRVIIENDLDNEFKPFLEKSEIKDKYDFVLLNYQGHDLCPHAILGKLCLHGASKCASVMFSHKIGSLMNLNIKNCYGSHPLNDAAINLSSSLVKTLLDHGANCELLSLIPVTGQRISSLDFALESLSFDRNLVNWSPKKSVFKLIITLCLPQMREARETITLLAGVATHNTLADTIFNAVRRGQVVQVAALLLVARDKILGVSFSGSTTWPGSMVFREAIMNELAALINQKYTLMGKQEHTMILKLCMEKEGLMIYILKMIEIFNRAGSELNLILKQMNSNVLPNEHVSREVAELFKKAYFTLTNKDTDTSDISESDESWRVQLYAVMEQQGYNAEDNPGDNYLKSCRCAVKNPTCTARYLLHRIGGSSSLPYVQHRGLSSHAGPSVQPSGTIPGKKVFRKVELQDSSRSTVKDRSGKWLQLQTSKNIVRSVSVLMAALRRGVRGV
ncbi:hypothetical protein POM88_009998 [Heracleum sosnowskyi]|uniref:Uncharacterized protein n=1 Tax=Heracleum sosnowskyi TaxID=360622 RepID=A0AAD8JCU5_9APIA|nr:hypothetical protein POM88_009998 [Heracleum sosnowskyi]